MHSLKSDNVCLLVMFDVLAYVLDPVDNLGCVKCSVLLMGFSADARTVMVRETFLVQVVDLVG